jgi:hypothetical protein
LLAGRRYRALAATSSTFRPTLFLRRPCSPSMCFAWCVSPQVEPQAIILVAAKYCSLHCLVCPQLVAALQLCQRAVSYHTHTKDMPVDRPQTHGPRLVTPSRYSSCVPRATLLKHTLASGRKPVVRHSTTERQRLLMAALVPLVTSCSISHIMSVWCKWLRGTAHLDMLQ